MNPPAWRAIIRPLACADVLVPAGPSPFVECGVEFEGGRLVPFAASLSRAKGNINAVLVKADAPMLPALAFKMNGPVADRLSLIMR